MDIRDIIGEHAQEFSADYCPGSVLLYLELGFPKTGRRLLTLVKGLCVLD